MYCSSNGETRADIDRYPYSLPSPHSPRTPLNSADVIRCDAEVRMLEKQIIEEDLHGKTKGYTGRPTVSFGSNWGDEGGESWRASVVERHPLRRAHLSFFPKSTPPSASPSPPHQPLPRVQLSPTAVVPETDQLPQEPYRVLLRPEEALDPRLGASLRGTPRTRTWMAAVGRSCATPQP